MEVVKNTLQRLPLNQFVKYCIAGGVTFALHLLLFAALNETIFPASTSLVSSERGWNFFWSFSTAFIMANIVGYFINRQWVFVAGRHGQLMELGLFYLFAIAAYFLGTPLGAYLVAVFPINEYLVFISTVAVSALVNFLGRKLVVFQS